MSSYTTQLKTLIEMHTQNDYSMSHKDRIENGRTKLFDFEYPIFDPDYKKVFETHFIRKFYTREIGFETEGLFKFQLETWLIINMPYFNRLFESELIEFDPLTNSKSDVTHKKTKENISNTIAHSDTNSSNHVISNTSSNGSVTDDNFNRQLESNNPDSRLTITSNDGQGVIEYASNISEDNENNHQMSTNEADEDTTTTNDGEINSTNDTEINETEDFIQSRIGKIGVQSYSKMLGEYRDSFIRIENKIFEEMQQLFMLVY